MLLQFNLIDDHLTSDILHIIISRKECRGKMKKFEITFPLIWLILLLKPEFRAADYRAMLDKKGKPFFIYTMYLMAKYLQCLHSLLNMNIK